METLNVAAAILIYENKILCAQRAGGKQEYISYKYEFPGGKAEAGETWEKALQRELMEEMELAVDIGHMKLFYDAKHEYPDFKVRIRFFICPVESKQLHSKEHTTIRWVEKQELDKLDWMEANWPVIEKLKRTELKAYLPQDSGYPAGQRIDKA